MNILFTSKEELCRCLLKRDMVYRYIPVSGRKEMSDYAWNKGKQAARKIKDRFPEAPMDKILSELSINVRICEQGAYQIFSEFYQNRKEIVLNRNSIRDNFISANNEVLRTDDFNVIKQLFQAHELFHYLECFDSEIGLTYHQHKVSVKKIWKFNYLVGVLMLSEIGAYSFTRHFVDFTELTAAFFDAEKGISGAV